MADLQGFNANEVDPSAGREPLPAGKYIAVITHSEMKPTKNGRGKYLELTFQVIEGDQRHRNVWARLNLDNQSDTAVKIARAELSAICRACGVMQPRDSVELHDLPIQITVACKKGNDDNIYNEIKGYAKKEAGQGQPQQASGDFVPPWKR